MSLPMRSTANCCKLRFQFSLKALLLLFVTVAMLTVLFNPRIITGHFCYITIDELNVSENGGFSVKYSRIATPGTKVSLITPSGASSGAITGGAFTWYVRGAGAGGGGVNLQRLGLDEEDWLRSIQVEQGKTYRIELGERLLLYQVHDPNTGRTSEAYIVFQQYPRR